MTFAQKVLMVGAVGTVFLLLAGTFALLLTDRTVPSEIYAMDGTAVGGIVVAFGAARAMASGVSPK